MKYRPRRSGRSALLSVSIACAALCAACSEPTKVEGFPDEFVGIGVELKIANEQPVLVRTLEGGPAAQAGLLPGDRFLAIEGVDTTGMSLGDVVVRLRGRPGSQVTVTVDRKGESIHVVVRRQKLTKKGEDYRAVK